MSMTRKDYTLIAIAIREGATPPNNWYELDGNACQLVYQIAEALEANNDNFDRAVFLKKCGL